MDLLQIAKLVVEELFIKPGQEAIVGFWDLEIPKELFNFGDVLLHMLSSVIRSDKASVSLWRNVRLMWETTKNSDHLEIWLTPLGWNPAHWWELGDWWINVGQFYKPSTHCFCSAISVTQLELEDDAAGQCSHEWTNLSLDSDSLAGGSTLRNLFVVDRNWIFCHKHIGKGVRENIEKITGLKPV